MTQSRDKSLVTGSKWTGIWGFSGRIHCWGGSWSERPLADFTFGNEPDKKHVDLFGSSTSKCIELKQEGIRALLPDQG